MAAPFNEKIRKIEALEGEPRVTYPEGDLNYPLVERVIKDPRSKALLNFYEPEPDAARFPNCILTGQQELTGDRHVAQMYRRYERLPGRKQATLVEHDAEARVDIWRVEWNERRTIAPPAVGGRINIDTGSGIIAGAIVLNHGKTPLDGARNRVWVEACKMPRVRYERVSLGYTFPGVFVYKSGWLFDNDFTVRKPWLGVHYDYTSPRSFRVTGRRELSWTLTQPTALPIPFNVFTNAQLSRVFPSIGPKTVHGAFSLTEYTGGGSSAVVERFPASSPSAYSRSQIIIAEAQSRVWRGPIYLTEVIKVCEARSL